MATSRIGLIDTKIKECAASVAARLGYQSLKTKQEDVLVKFLGGNDVFAVLPTGYGKSLCFACLPWMFDELDTERPSSIVIVVSPLTAIMIDQVQLIELVRRNLLSTHTSIECNR